MSEVGTPALLHVYKPETLAEVVSESKLEHKIIELTPVACILCRCFMAYKIRGEGLHGSGFGHVLWQYRNICHSAVDP